MESKMFLDMLMEMLLFFIWEVCEKNSDIDEGHDQHSSLFWYISKNISARVAAK